MSWMHTNPLPFKQIKRPLLVAAGSRNSQHRIPTALTHQTVALRAGEQFVKRGYVAANAPQDRALDIRP